MTELSLLLALVLATIFLVAIAWRAFLATRYGWGTFLLWAALFLGAVFLGLALNHLNGGAR